MSHNADVAPRYPPLFGCWSKETWRWVRISRSMAAINGSGMTPGPLGMADTIPTARAGPDGQVRLSDTRNATNLDLRLQRLGSRAAPRVLKSARGPAILALGRCATAPVGRPERSDRGRPLGSGPRGQQFARRPCPGGPGCLFRGPPTLPGPPFIKADTVAGKRFEVAYNRSVIGRIQIDNLYVAQTEKDQALAQFVQSLRGYWQAYFRLRRVKMFDFETGNPIQ